MAVIEINKNPSRYELRMFSGIGMPIFCAIMGAWRLHQSGDLILATILWGIGLLVAVIGLRWPTFVRPLFLGWMYAIFPIGWTISHLILAVIYYLVLTPIGLMVRLFRPDQLGKRFDRTAKTYWVPHEPEQDRTRYFRQF